jgi:hypothetical protein
MKINCAQDVTPNAWRRLSAFRLVSSLCLALLCIHGIVWAQPENDLGARASVPYTPSWQSRHAIVLLVDEAGLALTTGHWPLPSAAVEQALSRLHTSDAMLMAAKALVLRDIAQHRASGHATVRVQNATEWARGFGDSAGLGPRASIITPVWLSSPATREVPLTWAVRLGAEISAASNSTRQDLSVDDRSPRYAATLAQSAAVVGWGNWQLQAFQQRYWWGVGWQSSLVNGNNQQPWLGLGLQRSTAEPSTHPWLTWMGPWNLDVFVAKAQDPLVVPNQAQGFWFSGARLSLRPQPWLEMGLSRGLQFGGAGRPDGLGSFAKAFFGQEVNKEATDRFGDSSGQIAGYDLRLRCPAQWGNCALYTQWMGEDAAGNTPPWPYKFMSLWGAETTWADGRYRLFGEYVDTHAFSLPWDQRQPFPGYVNGVYRQGYTNGARWAGSAFGSGSKVLTLGWMDAQTQTRLLVHTGSVGRSVGTFTPALDAPHGNLFAFDFSRQFDRKLWSVTPSVGYSRLSQGQSQGDNRRDQWRLGLEVTLPLMPPR